MSRTTSYFALPPNEHSPRPCSRSSSSGNRSASADSSLVHVRTRRIAEPNLSPEKSIHSPSPPPPPPPRTGREWTPPKSFPHSLFLFLLISITTTSTSRCLSGCTLSTRERQSEGGADKHVLDVRTKRRRCTTKWKVVQSLPPRLLARHEPCTTTTSPQRSPSTRTRTTKCDDTISDPRETVVSPKFLLFLLIPNVKLWCWWWKWEEKSDTEWPTTRWLIHWLTWYESVCTWGCVGRKCTSGGERVDGWN